MSDDVEAAAKSYAKSIRAKFAREILESPDVQDDPSPTTIFMAGSPGAGKTEASKEMIAGFDIIRVDPDEYRSVFPMYNGANSSRIQGGVSLLVERVFDRLVKSKKSFLLDGTFSNQEKALTNVDRCLKHEREVRIWYVYQDPELSWEFVLAREVVEGRGIPVDSFVHQYYTSRAVVQSVKDEFKDRVKIDVLVKQIDSPCKAEFHEDILDLEAVCPKLRSLDELRASLRSAV